MADDATHLLPAQENTETMTSEGARVTSRGLTRVATLGILLTIFFLGMGLRLHELDGDSLWGDEILTSQRAQLGLPTLLSLLASGEGLGVQLPLNYAVTHLFVVGFGPSEFTLRLPPMLIGSLSILLIYKVGEMLWSRGVGMSAALLVAVNAYHVQYSQEARQYALMVFLALLSLVFLVKALQRNAPSLWVAFVVSTSLGLYTHYFAFLFLPAEVLLAAWSIWDDWRLGRTTNDSFAPGPGVFRPRPCSQALGLSLSLLAIAASMLPWASPLLAVASSPAGSGEPSLSILTFGHSLELLRDVLVSFGGVEGLALALSLGLLAVGLARSSAKTTGLVILAIAVPVVFLAIINPEKQVVPKYVLFWLPLYHLAVAQGLTFCAGLTCTHLQRTAAEGRRFATVGRVVAVLLFASLSLGPLTGYYLWDKEDWRGAVSYLNENMSAGDIIIADGEGYGGGGDYLRALRGLDYYFSLSGQAKTILPAQRGLADEIHNLPDREAHAWGVLWHSSELADSAQLDEEVEIRELPSIALITVARPDGALLENTVAVLKAMAGIQPSVVGRFDLHLALAELYWTTGNQQEAATQLELAGLAQPEHTNAGLMLAQSYEDQERFEDAVAQYLIFLQTPSAMGNARWQREAYIGLGVAYTQLNKPAELIAAYQQALESDPADPELLFLLGEAYQGLGRIDEARLAYQDVLRIDPDHQRARRTLELLSAPVQQDIPHPLLRSLGLKMALLGYDLSPGAVEAGGTLDLSLWWQALADMDKDYSAFVHLIDGGGRIWAQEDMVLLDDQRPTSTWKVGKVVKSDYGLEVPTDAPPGDYTVMVGLYFWETGARLPVWNADGQRLPGDIVEVQHIQVHNSSE